MPSCTFPTYVISGREAVKPVHFVLSSHNKVMSRSITPANNILKITAHLSGSERSITRSILR